MRLCRQAVKQYFSYDTEGTYSQMSLKAKLEAVIYAAEEPVTLAQLAVLFADEALEHKAEQEAALVRAAREQMDDAPLLEGVEAGPEAAAEGAVAAEAELQAEAPVPEVTEGEANEAGAEADSADSTEQTAEAEAVSESEDAGEVEAAAAGEAAVDGELANPDGVEPEPEVEPTEAAPGAVEGEQTEGDEPESEEAAAKRLAKQRDREVKSVLRQVLDELIADYASDRRGVEIREIAGGYRMATKAEFHDAVRGFVKSLKPAMKLSLPALETLAVVAYKQPVTAPEVNEIRGVESSGVFGSLLARKLIATAGRKQVIGRPILYKTTKEFLLRFGLKDLNELPSMEEFEKMAASELDEPDVEMTAETVSVTASAAPAEEGENHPTEAPAAEPEPTQEPPTAIEAANETDEATSEDAPAAPPAVE